MFSLRVGDGVLYVKTETDDVNKHAHDMIGIQY